MQPRKIVVEAIIPAPVELVWDRTQNPEQHLRWDIRFTDIRYLNKTDKAGFSLMEYRTRVGFGVGVQGTGRYLQNTPPHHSTFEFESGDWKSLISFGRGIWQYEPSQGGTYFKTVYDYKVRYGQAGRVIDVVFRRVMQLATEWGFETLRLWCSGDQSAPQRRRSRWKFALFFLSRLAGRSPTIGSARSWLGSGNEAPMIPVTSYPSESS
jgi:uncharacterized protein YndB with AHSA1/START domain